MYLHNVKGLVNSIIMVLIDSILGHVMSDPPLTDMSGTGHLYIMSEIDLLFLVGGFSSSGQSATKADAEFAVLLPDLFLLASQDCRPVFGGLPPSMVRGGHAVGRTSAMAAGDVFVISARAGSKGGSVESFIASIA